MILFDETCLSPGAFLNVLNSALEQRQILFPSREMIDKHEHCFILFADNSAGYGNDPKFPERGDIGGAFRDRISYVDFAYDEKIEIQVLTEIFQDTYRAQKFHRMVKAMRAWLETQGDLPVFASPRFAYKAAKLLMEQTVPLKRILSMQLYRGINEDILQRVRPKAEEIFRGCESL